MKNVLVKLTKFLSVTGFYGHHILNERITFTNDSYVESFLFCCEITYQVMQFRIDVIYIEWFRACQMNQFLAITHLNYIIMCLGRLCAETHSIK